MLQSSKVHSLLFISKSSSLELVYRRHQRYYERTCKATFSDANLWHFSTGGNCRTVCQSKIQLKNYAVQRHSFIFLIRVSQTFRLATALLTVTSNCRLQNTSYSKDSEALSKLPQRSWGPCLTWVSHKIKSNFQGFKEKHKISLIMQICGVRKQSQQTAK